MFRLIVFLAFVQIVVFAKMNKKLRQKILVKHLQLRQLVASGKAKDGNGRRTPTAEAMMKLQWDMKLEKAAGKWTNTCPFGIHDNNRGDDVGENMAADSHNNDAVLVDMIDRWFKEIKNAPVKDYNKLSTNEMKHKMGHYTQLVWGTTRKLGCDFRTNCYSPQWKRNATFLVCRYSPKGNIYNWPIYKTGKPCSRCEKIGAVCDNKYKALCSFDKKKKEKKANKGNFKKRVISPIPEHWVFDGPNAASALIKIMRRGFLKE